MKIENDDRWVKALETLLEEGAAFTTESAAGGTNDRGFLVGETSAWWAFRTRVRKLVFELFHVDSAPAELFRRGEGMTFSGNYPARFEDARATFTMALELGIKILSSEEGDIYGERQTPAEPTARQIDPRKVFVVHGHDEDLKQQLELFLGQIGLKPIVLHRQPDSGKTIIEKLEGQSDVGFAFILLTPDEIAYLVSEGELPEEQRKTERRARPNVIFEFGYFVGYLGRKNVCCLHKGNVELPSDLHGVIYKRVSGTVEQIGVDILKELQAAGYKASILGE